MIWLFVGGGMHEKFWSEDLKGQYHSEDMYADRRIILDWIIRKLDWIHLAQNRTSSGLL